MSVIDDTNFQKLCRACLRTLKETNLGTNSGNNDNTKDDEDRASSQLKSLLLPNLCKLFMFLTTYDVNSEDKNFPKLLCEWCYKRLIDYDEFRKLAIKSTEILFERRNAFLGKEDSSTEINSKELYSRVNIKRENDEEIDDDQLLLPELANMSVLTIKTETNFEAMETQLILPSIAEETNTALTSYKSNNVEGNTNDQEIVPTNVAETSNRPLKSFNKGKKSAKNFHCDDCNKNFHKESYLEAHVRVTHNAQKKPFKCSVCGKVFTRLRLLTDHITSKHSEELISLEDQVNSSQENQLELSNFCDMCRRNYSSKRALREHIKRHKKIKEHVCKECGAAKVTRTELVTHMRTHIPNLEKFSCPQCPQVFNHKNAISRHVKVVHEGLKRYKCSYCPKQFGTRNSQVCHERLHTGERPFICEICKKGFAQQDALKSHMKNHDKNLRTHICKYCSRRCITMKNLRDHEKRHSSDKPHICNICSKGFAKNEELRKHLFTHFEVGTVEYPEVLLEEAAGVQ